MFGVRPVARAAGVGLLPLLIAGCPPDFDRFHLTPAPGADAGPRPDGAPPPPPDGGPPPMTTGGPCAVPHLLVAVEGLEDSRPRIVRYELGETGVVRRCGDLVAGGELLQQPFTVGWLDDGHVAVSGFDVLQVIDPMADREVWQVRLDGWRAVDVTRLRMPSGTDVLAVAWSSRPDTPEIRTIRFYGLDDPAPAAPEIEANTADSGLGLGVYSMTQSPIRLERLMFMKPVDYAAADYDVQMTDRLMPVYSPTRDGLNLRTLHALDDGTSNRLAWTGAESGEEGVFYVSDTTGMAPNPPSMPRTCTNFGCRTFAHAVADPTHPHRIYAICEPTTFEDAALVRLSVIAGDCEVIAEARSFATGGGRARMSRLAVAWRAP